MVSSIIINNNNYEKTKKAQKAVNFYKNMKKKETLLKYFPLPLPKSCDQHFLSKITINEV